MSESRLRIAPFREASLAISAIDPSEWEMFLFAKGEVDAETGSIGTFKPHAGHMTGQDRTWHKLGSALDSKSFRDAFMEDPQQRAHDTLHALMPPNTDWDRYWSRWEGFSTSKPRFERYLHSITVEYSVFRCVWDSP